MRALSAREHAEELVRESGFGTARKRARQLMLASSSAPGRRFWGEVCRKITAAQAAAAEVAVEKIARAVRSSLRAQKEE